MTSNNLVTFLVDDRKFVLTKDTFNDYPHSLLTQIINHETNDKTIYVDPSNNNVFHVNRDPKAFKYIVDHLRGYDVNLDNIKSHNLRAKVLQDLKYFNIDYKIINLNVDTEPVNEIFGEEALESLLNPIGHEYNRNNTPLLNQYQESLEKQFETKTETESENVSNLMNELNKNYDNGSMPVELINTLSNNDDIKKMIIESQLEKVPDSDTDSLEIKSDNDDETSYKTTERYIEIN